MPKVILQLELDPATASVDKVRQDLKLDPAQIDADFGVRQVRKGQPVFAVRVDADVAGRVRGERRSGTPRRGTRVALMH